MEIPGKGLQAAATLVTAYSAAMRRAHIAVAQGHRS